jgi:hypothetical protein
VAAQKWDSIMRFHRYARAFGAAFLVTSTLAAGYALAGPADYRFELVQAQPAGPGRTTVTVRLVHAPDSKPVDGAVLFESKTDMGPVGMAEMTGKVSSLPSDKPGLYRFQIETGMAGKWALNLDAKVQGEPGTVRGTVVYEAK